MSEYVPMSDDELDEALEASLVPTGPFTEAGSLPAPPLKNWWENLSEDQNWRLGQVIDSRVRLLGETYSVAYRRATKNISEQNKEWVLGEQATAD